MTAMVTIRQGSTVLYVMYTRGLLSEINPLLLFICKAFLRRVLLPGMEDPIREVCDELLGPVCRSKSTQRWDNTILVSVTVIASCLSNRHFVTLVLPPLSLY